MAAGNPSSAVPKDGNYAPTSGVVVSPGTGIVLPQASANVLTDSVSGQQYAPTTNDPLLKSGADGVAANTVPEVALARYNGSTVDRERIPVVFKTFAAQAITAGTPVALWTPTTGKKFRLMGYSLSLSVAGYLIFKDNTSVILNSAAVTAGAGTNSPGMGNGILSSAANNVLNLDVSASGNVSGFVFGTEE